MRRRWLAIAGALLLALLVMLALLPWWTGVAARIAAGRLGANFRAYERIDYTRFALTDVEVRRAATVVKVARVEADTPLLWAWRHLNGRRSPIVVTEWSVDVARSSTPPAATPAGWMPLRARLQRVAGALDRWLPEASVGRGSVRWPGGGLEIESARWRAGELRVDTLAFRGFAADVTLGFLHADDRILAQARGADGAALELTSRGADLTGRVEWWAQAVDLGAKFAAQGWMPAAATLRADEVRLPGERLKLADAYDTLAGHARMDWDVDHFLADIALHGTPAAGKAAPPLDLTVRGRGTGSQFTLETLRAAFPGGTVDLSAPVTVRRDGRIEGAGARLALRADLERQRWVSATGVVQGEARVRGGGSGSGPTAEFALSGEDLRAVGVELRKLSAAAELQWPRLLISELRIDGGPAETLRASGGWDFRDHEIVDGKISGTLRRERVARWVPVQFEGLTIEAAASGKIDDLISRGRIDVRNLQYARLRPSVVSAEWQGRGGRVERFSARADLGKARLAAAGSASARDVSVSQFSFEIDGARVLELSQPARVTWRPTLVVEPIRLVGKDAAIDARLEWGTRGRIDLAARGVAARWVDALYPLNGPDWTLVSFALTGTWDNGPMAYSTAGELKLALPDRRSATVNLASRGNAQGVILEALHAVENGTAVANASGRFPVVITPGRRPLASFRADGALEMEASTVPNAAFWQELAVLSGIEVRAPEVNARIRGTWDRPEGEVRFRAERAAMDPKRFARALPTVDGMDLLVTANGSGITLDRLSFRVEGQAVRAAGRLPVQGEGWRQLMRSPAAYLEKGGELRVEVPDAEVAMFSRFLPSALAPAGRLQADLRFARGDLRGELTLRNAASRPLGPLGVLQDVSAEVQFADHRVELRRVTATSGGQPVTLAGAVELPRGGWGAKTLTEPKYDITLKGRNLPFVRQAGLLMRGDVDLRLRSPASGAPAITGDVVLRDSLFLSDVRAMLPRGGGASPARRPPYFAVETPPLNTWTLDVAVSGDRFLRVRTPVFVGVASSRFHLGGTLGEPRAIGEATIDEGQVLMPFATFEVQQGAVRLSEESPYEPAIYLRGAGRHWGYDLAMEVSGKASNPSLTLTSSPALDPEQVLLMVMTGAAPSTEVSTSLTHRAVQIGRFFGQSIVGSLTGGGGQPDRLSVESGEKISRQGRETYSIEYKLDDRWSVTGEYDEFDEYNAGLKWRVAPRRKR